MKHRDLICTIFSDLKALSRRKHPLKKLGVCIGMLTHGSSLYSRQIGIGFSFGLVAQKSLQPALFQPMHSLKLADLHRNAEQLLLSPFINVIFTVGPLATHVLYQTSSRLGIKKLVLFAGVTNPIELGVITSYSEPSNFCGVLDDFSLQDRFDAFFHLFPEVKNVVLAYDPTHGHIAFARNKVSMNNFLVEKGFHVVDVAVNPSFRTQESLDFTLKTLQSSEGKTVVVTVPEMYNMSVIETIALVAQKYGVPLYSFDTETAKEGFVSCASGVDSNELGIYISKRVITLLHSGPTALGLSEKHTLPKITVVSTRLFSQLSSSAQAWCIKNANIITAPLP